MTSEAVSSPAFFVAGGTLQRDARCYVSRRADTEIQEALKRGEFCYVLTSRQMGKSSLMVRTAHLLRQEGVAVAVLDLTAIGQNLTLEQWYNGLLEHLGYQFDLEDALEDCWLAHLSLSPLQRFLTCLREVVLERVPGNLVLLLDEIDVVRSLPFSTDEFFAAVREGYNRRTEDPRYRRLTFALFGVAAPSDLIKDPRVTPFNIGRRVELADFTPEEARKFAEGLGREPKRAEALLNRVLHWTHGHPYLTQRLCQAIAEDSSVHNGKGVDRKCAELFLSARAKEQDNNLLFVRERLLRSDTDLAALLELYRQIWKGKRVPDEEANPLVTVLRLSGIVRTENGVLQSRNQIYHRVFHAAWIQENMPGAEVKRQKRAFQRGIRYSLLASLGLWLAVSGGAIAWEWFLYSSVSINSVEVTKPTNANITAMSATFSGMYLNGTLIDVLDESKNSVLETLIPTSVPSTDDTKIEVSLPGKIVPGTYRLRARRQNSLLFGPLQRLLPVSDSGATLKISPPPLPPMEIEAVEGGPFRWNQTVTVRGKNLGPLRSGYSTASISVESESLKILQWTPTKVTAQFTAKKFQNMNGPKHMLLFSAEGNVTAGQLDILMEENAAAKPQSKTRQIVKIVPETALPKELVTLAIGGRNSVVFLNEMLVFCEASYDGKVRFRVPEWLPAGKYQVAVQSEGSKKRVEVGVLTVVARK